MLDGRGVLQKESPLKRKWKKRHVAHLDGVLAAETAIRPAQCIEITQGRVISIQKTTVAFALKYSAPVILKVHPPLLLTLPLILNGHCLWQMLRAFPLRQELC